jgi:pimeloyl-ACP methyl ester carboxylesterase
MGGTIATHVAAKTQDIWRGVILSGPGASLGCALRSLVYFVEFSRMCCGGCSAGARS